jgi:DNA-directed RNA polymerase alpha subunit
LIKIGNICKNMSYNFKSIYKNNLNIYSMAISLINIKKVNYKVKLIHDTKGNIKESLNLEITTNGSITPKRAIQEALKVLMNLFYNLFVTPEFLKISKQTLK